MAELKLTLVVNICVCLFNYSGDSGESLLPDLLLSAGSVPKAYHSDCSVLGRGRNNVQMLSGHNVLTLLILSGHLANISGRTYLSQ